MEYYVRYSIGHLLKSKCVTNQNIWLRISRDYELLLSPIIVKILIEDASPTYSLTEWEIT